MVCADILQCFQAVKIVHTDNSVLRHRNLLHDERYTLTQQSAILPTIDFAIIMTRQKLPESDVPANNWQQQHHAYYYASTRLYRYIF